MARDRGEFELRDPVVGADFRGEEEGAIERIEGGVVVRVEAKGGGGTYRCGGEGERAVACDRYWSDGAHGSFQDVAEWMEGGTSEHLSEV